MRVLISMLRGVNVGGHNQIKMDALRELYTSLKFENPQTYVQSGNVIFLSNQRDLEKVAKRIQQGIEKRFACRPEILVRTAGEMRAVIAQNPFAKRSGIEPAKLLVSFLRVAPSPTARKELHAREFSPEEIHVIGRELYIYFPNGMGKSKLPWSRLDKLLGTAGTGRNWNSVTKMVEIANSMEA